MGFDFSSATRESTKSLNLRVPEGLLKAYEAEAQVRNTTVTDLVLQAMRFALQQVAKTRQSRTPDASATTAPHQG